MSKLTLPPLGAHVSTAGGLFTAFERATHIGASAIQIFGASPRQWHTKSPSIEDVEKFKEAWKASEVSSIFLHASYLVNIASSDEGAIAKSVKSLSDHLSIAEYIGAQGLIFHVGSGKELPKDLALKSAVAAMKHVLEMVPGTSQLIIENSAGGGQKLGSNPQEIGAMMEGVNSARIKSCYDTAHGFEAGLIEAYTPERTKQLFDLMDSAFGLENLVALHVNDSKTAFNSHHDRHENIGEGFIGIEGFRTLAHEKRLHDKAWLLEVPGFDGQGPDKQNMDMLKSCFE